MPGVLCAGNVLVDLLTRPVGDIAWNTTAWIDQIEQGIGGNGANTSFALARLGVRVRLMGMVGPDPFGDFCRQRLAGAGVDLSLLRQAAAPTGCTVVLVRSDGARALLHRPGASYEAFPEPVRFTPDEVAGCTHFHMANVFGLPLLRRHAGETLANARAAGLFTSLDTGWDARGEWLPVADPCFPHLDLLFVNEDEARLLSGSAEPAAAARFFRDRGARTVVVKLGARGCAVFSDDGAWSVPGYSVPVVDTTGAGDCFAGGFLAAMLEGSGLIDAARFANAVGALSVGGLGATAGLLDREATERWIAGQPSGGVSAPAMLP